MTMTFVNWFNIVLAFVSMGGKDRTDGNIDCKKLIAMVKDEFKLTIDIEVIFINKIEINLRNWYWWK